MAAITANFVIPSPSGSASADAFVGLFDLSRMLLRSDPSTTVVCEACRTINRDGALFCKGCAGKLPAFYAAGIAAEGASQAAASRDEIAPTALTLAVAVLGFTAALATTLALLGLWYGGGATVDPMPARAVSPSSAHAVATAAAPSAPAAAHPAMGPSFQIAASNLTPATTAFADEPAAPPPAVTRAAAKREPRWQAAERRTTRPAGNPLASCDGRNFIAHAVCVNNRCAQPGNAQRSQCQQPLRQRRQDEARRNLFLGN
ncbi:hypothetical protein J7E62_06370 [Variovorax paradoxus]|nr:hypothetical protein [Variovorax paradoxus]